MTEPKPNKRAIARAALERKMQDACRAEFLEKGYEGTTIRSIAERTGMSTGAFFVIYDTKDAAWKDVTGLKTPNEMANEALAGLVSTERSGG